MNSELSKTSFTTLLLKLFAGGIGGAAGSLILIGLFLLTSTFTANAFQDSESLNPIVIAILLVMIFLASSIGNILSIWLIFLTEREKYIKISPPIYQSLILSTIIFLLMVPIYFIAISNVTVMLYITALHIILSAQTSALLLESGADSRHTFLAIYGITLGVFSSVIIMLVLNAIIPSPQILLFIALPIVWGSIALMHNLFLMIYGTLARIYEKDFLSIDTLYGGETVNSKIKTE